MTHEELDRLLDRCAMSKCERIAWRCRLLSCDNQRDSDETVTIIKALLESEFKHEVMLMSRLEKLEQKHTAIECVVIALRNDVEANPEDYRMGFSKLKLRKALEEFERNYCNKGEAK